MMLNAFAQIGCKIEQSRDRAHNQKQDCWNGQQNRQLFGILQGSGQCFRPGIIRNGIRTNSGQDISRLGLPRAAGGTIAAIVTQPDIRVSNKLIFQAPGGGDHFFAGKRFGIGRNRTGNRTGGALIALFQVCPPQRTHFFNKI